MIYRLFRLIALTSLLLSGLGCSRQAMEAVMSAPAAAASLQSLTLTIEVDSQSQQFLIDTGQTVLITSSDPSQDNTLVVVQSFLPFGDQSLVTVDTTPVLFLSPAKVTPFGSVTVNLVSAVSYGQAYLFNGSSITNDGPGIPGLVSIRYMPVGTGAVAVTTGLALTIGNSSVGGATSTAAFSYYDLQPFENRLLRPPSTVLYVLIGQNITTGMTLPASLLQPIPGSAPSSATASSQQDAAPAPIASSIQLGRYLPVDLLFDTQSVTHFDPSVNAFAYGAYPD
ncbi:hypothetical protein [Skermanella aerolata]|nr:hypothetical protein [Skermanella aerolata]